MSTTICRPCVGLPCDNPPDLAAGIDGAIYSALDYSFVVQCPQGCFCPPDLFPQTISILASTIPPVIPPIIEPGIPIILRLQGCSALITRTLDAGSTQDQINAAAQSMQAEWAGQQALCIALSTPGVNCNTGDSISICNDAQDFVCYTGTPIHVNAGIFCQTLVTTGLTAEQIAAQSAVIKTNLNTLAKDSNSDCPFAHQFCAIVVNYTGLPGSRDIKYTLTNNSTVPFDATQLCIVLVNPGAGTFCGANNNVLPGNSYSFDILPGVPNHFRITYLGVALFDSGGIPPSDATVTIFFCQ